MPERVWKIGDWCKYEGKRWLVYRSDEVGIGIVARDGKTLFRKGNNAEIVPLRECTGWDWQAPPTYRPFANAEEVADYLLVAIRVNSMPSLITTITMADDRSVWVGGRPGVSYEQAMRDYSFYGGKPFGFEVCE